MSTQVRSPFPVLTDRQGRPLASGSVYIGEPDKDPEIFPQAAFLDERLTRPARQPLRVENGYIVDVATPAAVFVSGAFSIRVLDGRGAPVFDHAHVIDDDALKMDLPSAAGGKGAAMVGFLQTGKGAVPRSVLAKLREWVTPEDFGAVGDGTADDTAALAAMYASGHRQFMLPGAYRITAPLMPPAGSRTTGQGSGRIVVQTEISAFNIAKADRVRIADLEIQSTFAGSRAYVCGVVISASSHCEVRNCSIGGFQWAGVFLADADHNKVVDNRFGPVPDSAPNSSDICIYYNSSYNLVQGNECLGGGFFGILVQDPAGQGKYLPRRNKIIGNLVRGARAHGIVVYIGPPAGLRNSDNLISQNTVEDVSGSVQPESYGSGIYCVGMGIGGLQVTDNRIINCCTQSTGRSNGMAGIAINGFGTSQQTGAGKPLVSGNTVTGMTQGDGIGVVACTGGAVIGPNSVEMPAGNDGRGRGGPALLGQALRIQDSSNVSVTGGSYVNLGTGDAIMVLATSWSMEAIVVSGLIVHSAKGLGLLVTGIASQAARLNPLRISRASFSGIGGSARAALTAVVADNSLFSGFAIATTDKTAVQVTDCVGSLFVANQFSGANCVLTTGTCTGSTFSLDNQLKGNFANEATGLRYVRYASAPPRAGTAAAGDQIVNSAPGIGLPKGWTCTVAGSPGTWKSQGSL